MVEIVDAEGRWTLREYEDAGQTCVELRAGLGGGSHCATDGEESFGLLGTSNSTFASDLVADEESVSVPEELLAAASDFAYAYGRVPQAVTHVRVTTNLGGSFTVPTLGDEEAAARYFVVAIPAANVPIEMQVERVDFTEDRDVDGGDVKWSEQRRYLSLERFSGPVDSACVERLAQLYNDVPFDDLDVDPEPTPEAGRTFLERIEGSAKSEGVDLDVTCEGSLGPDGRQELFSLLEPEVAALLQAGAKAAMEELEAGD